MAKMADRAAETAAASLLRRENRRLGGTSSALALALHRRCLAAVKAMPHRLGTASVMIVAIVALDQRLLVLLPAAVLLQRRLQVLLLEHVAASVSDSASRRVAVLGACRRLPRDRTLVPAPRCQLALRRHL